MANLGGTTYTVVVWTSGDIITEAKLDNMVANDQAYDSHATEGLLLNNTRAYCGKDTGATARDLIRLDSNNDVQIGESGINHVVLTPGANKETKITINAKARAYLSADQENIANNTWTKIQLDTEDSDPGGNFDAVTNYRFTAPVTGSYLVFAGALWKNFAAAGKLHMISVYKNGASYLSQKDYAHDTNERSQKIADMIDLTAGDFLELYVLHQEGAGTVDIDDDLGMTYLAVHLMSV